MKQLAWRAGAVILVVALLAGVFWGLRQAETRAQSSARGVVNLEAQGAGLGGGPLPGPGHVPPGTSGQVRAYAGLVEESAKRLLTGPAPYRPPWWARPFGALHKYDDVAAGPGFMRAYAETKQAEAQARTVADHEAAVMKALTGPLDYPAAMDLASSDPSAVTPSSKAAVTGLEAAAGKVKGLETPDDPTLEQVRGQLMSARQAFQGLLDTVGTPGQAAAQERALDEMQAAQQAILADRAAYTTKENQSLGAAFKKAAADLQSYANRLGQIQFSQ